MAFNLDGPAIDFEAETTARHAKLREEKSATTLTGRFAGLELRHGLPHDGWTIHARDVRTGAYVSIVSRYWPDAERDAFVDLPALRRALENGKVALSLTLRGHETRHGFEAHFATIG